MDPRQRMLFPLGEHLREALRADVESLGALKTVAGDLWPTLDPVAARKKLSNALNPNQLRNDLSMEDAVRIIFAAVNKHGTSHAITALTSKLPCEFTWITREEQRRRRVHDLAAALGSLQSVVERLQGDLEDLK